jgi:drug/metabolite transporter (DMT)-like permease
MARLPVTARGTSTGAFQAYDWLLIAFVAIVFGSSFVLIEIGLRAFAPAVIALARLALGVLTLALIPSARRAALSRDDARRVAIVGVAWMGVPLVLFPLAQQWIDSSTAGMVNGAMPLLTVLWTALLGHLRPGRTQAIGLTIGFIGIVAVALPELPVGGLGGPDTLLGVALALTAATLYGLSATLLTPIQQRHGSLPILLRAQVVGLLVILPFGLLGLRTSTFAWPSALAMLPLGILGTAAAFAAMATLIGRVGAPRGAVAIYFLPVVAIGLGVVVLGESVHPLALGGTALILVGAWLTSRREVIR